MSSPEDQLVSVAGRGDVDAAQKILMKGCDINARSGDHVPITAAAMNENLAMLKFLLLNGCDVNKKDLQGHTALNWAVLNDNVENARVLLWNGARTDLHRTSHHPIIIQACTYGAAHDYAMVELLIQGGCSVNHKSLDGTSALHCCAYQGNGRCVKLLLAAGAHVDKPDAWKRTPLTYAVSEQKHSTVEMLLKSGCCVNWMDSSRRTALHYSARRNQVHTVSSLLQHGADPNIQDGDSNIPLIEATFHNFIDVVRLLILTNCDVTIEGLCPSVKKSGPVSAWDIAVHRQNHLILQLLYVSAGTKLLHRNRQKRISGMLTFDNNKPLQEWFQEVTSNPMSLKNQCRCFLRSRLGLRIKDKLEQLAVPPGLRSFLMFDGDVLFSLTNDVQRFEIVIH